MIDEFLLYSLKEIKRSVYLDNTDELHLFDFEIDDLKNLLYIFFDPEQIDKTYTKLLSACRKNFRIHSDIKYLLEKECIFLTLTFSDDYINLTPKYLREYVKNYLNSLNCNYLCNVDFGKVNGRLHYHSIVQLPYLTDDQRLNYKFGNINFKKIITNTNVYKLSNYINKLTNHSTKNTTCNKRIMRRIKF